MYIKCLEIVNFRKFGDKENTITFVEPTKDLEDESSISASSSLIVGKNNSGKTTVSKALELLVSEKEGLSGHDFNYSYLNKVLNKYKSKEFDEYPEIKLKVTFGTNTKTASLINSGGAISLADAKATDGDKEFSIVVTYEVNNKIEFQSKMRDFIANNATKKNDDLHRLFINEISVTKFRKFVTNVSDSGMAIKPGNLIELKNISAANNIHDKKLLSKSFNKIIKYKYETNLEDLNTINKIVDDNNSKITENVSKSHESTIQNVLKKIIVNESLGIDLRADLTFDRLMDDLITYEHREGEYLVPEGQFGLGYANLISIISEIIDYIQRTPDGEASAKVRLICIEEPEAFMHPQMQINFIRHIDEAVKEIIGDKGKINSQILITTHSSHILNSKIHSSGSLNNINYVYPKGNHCECITIQDKDIADKAGIKDEFYFVKKHIKHQVPELFFSDAIVLVEGITEERLVNFYIESSASLSKKMISVFRIDGAHGKVYHKLLKKLRIPSLIITDIDFKREDNEKYELIEVGKRRIKLPIYPQMTEISTDRTTTNSTLSYYFDGVRRVEEFLDYPIKDNVLVVFQKDPIEIKLGEENKIEYYASSLEEALILENYKNTLVQKVLSTVVESEYKDIISDGSSEFNKLAENSYRLQKSLSSKKSEFANQLIYKLITVEDEKSLPSLPKYILDGLEWLVSKIDN
ncbi:putative ATP-dependent endonuclease of OLD family [Vibrio crassostreae]|uniref:ATP-dependent nuclease n=1 Tax=Vibrio crassostreae TaxID=246167 RepID=UPI0010EA7EEC|nr:AAA family ATPase [Vibrio crassostreae]TCN99264.1 putative ATP-dependent endonuclease of OLD family [Vibrio crassostreae]